MQTVARFEISHRRYLDLDGKPTGDLPEFANSTDELVKMYELMSLVRIFDAKAINLQRTGKLGTYASSLGHEAAHVGIGAAMRHEDVFAPMYREYGAQMWRGVKMSEILLYWGGDVDFPAPDGPTKATTSPARPTTLPGAYPLPPSASTRPAQPWRSSTGTSRAARLRCSATAALPKGHSTRH